jgi:hypothetical protein
MYITAIAWLSVTVLMVATEKNHHFRLADIYILRTITMRFLKLDTWHKASSID